MRALYGHLRSKAQGGGGNFHMIAWKALAERVALAAPVPGVPLEMLPEGIHFELEQEFPEFMQARRARFAGGAGGGAAAAAVPVARQLAEVSGRAAAEGEAARMRATNASLSAALGEKQEALADEQSRTADLEDRVRDVEGQLADLEARYLDARRAADRERRAAEASAAERLAAAARARAADGARRAAEASAADAAASRDALRADVARLSAAERAAREAENEARETAAAEETAKAARTRAAAAALLGDDDRADALSDAAARGATFREVLRRSRLVFGNDIWTKGKSFQLHVERGNEVGEGIAHFASLPDMDEAAPVAALKPLRVTYTAAAAEPPAAKRRKKDGGGDEAGVDDGGLTNEFYTIFWRDLATKRADLFPATGGELSSRQLPLVDADWPAGVDLTDAFVAVGRALCRAICDGRPVPRRLASPLVLRFLQGVEPAGPVGADGAPRRGPMAKEALLEEVVALDDDHKNIAEFVVGEEPGRAYGVETVGDVLCWVNDVDRAADRHAALLATPWRDGDPGFRVAVFEQLVQRHVVEPRRRALEAMREGFALVPDVPRLLRDLFPRQEDLVRFVSGDDDFAAETIWNLVSFDPDDYSQLLIEFEHESKGMYAKDDAVMRYLRETLEAFSELQRRDFFKFVTGLDSVPISRPGRAAGGAFKILVDGKDMTDLGRLPSASTCYYNIHIPNYATREILEDKLREAIVKPEGFDLE